MQPSVQFTQSVWPVDGHTDRSGHAARDRARVTRHLPAPTRHHGRQTASSLHRYPKRDRELSSHLEPTQTGNRRRLSTRQGWPRGWRRTEYADVFDADGLRPEAEADSHAQARAGGGSIAGIRSKPSHRRRVRTPPPSPTAALQVGRCMARPHHGAFPNGTGTLLRDLYSKTRKTRIPPTRR